MELTRTSAKDLHRNASTLLRRVRRGERFVIEWYQEDSALLLPIGDLERLEGNVSEDPAPYMTNEPPDFDQLQREDLAGFLAFNAYHQEHGDKQAAIRALAEAILKVQALP
jgi:antitoxin (DNA-binding transcriptional repressor) of toxin-antitoxin stability system